MRHLSQQQTAERMRVTGRNCGSLQALGPLGNLKMLDRGGGVRPLTAPGHGQTRFLCALSLCKTLRCTDQGKAERVFGKRVLSMQHGRGLAPHLQPWARNTIRNKLHALLNR